ncbi:MAG: hypothetical protein IJ594_08035 [Oscillospiraceae bacterium]|nr:hypothetical protein [Oscillospiraceae bacterium]
MAIIIEDTRQKDGKHQQKHIGFDSLGVDLLRCKLPFGDYALPPEVSVDTKENLEEIAGNLCGSRKERDRFIRECKAAAAAGCQLIVMVETQHEGSLLDLGDIRIGNGMTVTGTQLHRAMTTVAGRYGVRFVLVRPEDAAREIVKLLQEGRKR